MNFMASCKKILIVEDEADLIELTEKILQRYGYQTLRCLDGASAFALVLQENPDLIILDLTLPGKTGHEICAEIKSDPRSKNIPVLMTTGQQADDENWDDPQSGPNDILKKPFEINVMIEKVQQLLK